MIRKDSYEVPSIFKLMAKKGQVEEKMMYNTYNMGLGMVLAVDPADVDKQWKQSKQQARHHMWLVRSKTVKKE